MCIICIFLFAHWNVCSPREKLPKPVGHTDPGRAVACASQGPNGSHNGSMADPWQIHDPVVNTTAAPAARPAWLESRKRCSCSTPSTHTDVNRHNKQTNRLNRFRKNRPQIAFSTELEEFEKFDFNILPLRIRHKLTHHGNHRSVQGVVLATAVRGFSDAFLAPMLRGYVTTRNDTNIYVPGISIVADAHLDQGSSAQTSLERLSHPLSPEN